MPTQVRPFLMFESRAEEAMRFYASVFGTEITEPIMRMTDGPEMPGAPALSDAEKDLVMHMEVTILGGHVLQATDMIESMGHAVTLGNNMTIALEPDTRAENERLFAALSEGGSDVMGLMDMFWGSYFGTCVDKFGVRWMFNCEEKKA